MKTEEKKFQKIYLGVLEALNTTSYGIGKEIGVAANVLARLEKGENNPSYDYLSAIGEKYPQLNPDYLLTGVGSVLRGGNARPIGVMSNMEFVEVPFLSLEARATFIATYDDSATVELENFPVLKSSVNGFKNSILIEVEGTSMQPTLNHQTKVLCTKVSSNEWEYLSGVYAILYRDFFVIKRIKNNDLIQYKTLTLHSDNKEFGTVVIRGEEIREVWKAVKIYEQSLE
jgi:transcriptional regulator with XRE-family HTH domain